MNKNDQPEPERVFETLSTTKVDLLNEIYFKSGEFQACQARAWQIYQDLHQPLPESVFRLKQRHLDNLIDHISRLLSKIKDFVNPDYRDWANSQIIKLKSRKQSPAGLDNASFNADQTNQAVTEFYHQEISWRLIRLQQLIDELAYNPEINLLLEFSGQEPDWHLFCALRFHQARILISQIQTLLDPDSGRTYSWNPDLFLHQLWSAQSDYRSANSLDRIREDAYKVEPLEPVPAATEEKLKRPTETDDSLNQTGPDRTQNQTSGVDSDPADSQLTFDSDQDSTSLLARPEPADYPAWLAGWLIAKDQGLQLVDSLRQTRDQLVSQAIDRSMARQIAKFDSSGSKPNQAQAEPRPLVRRSLGRWLKGQSAESAGQEWLSPLSRRPGKPVTDFEDDLISIVDPE